MMETTSISSALTLLSSILGMATKVNEREFNQAIIELQKALLNIQKEAAQLQQENINLTNQLSDLKQNLIDRSALEYDGYAYWVKIERGFDGPFCSVCVDNEHKRIRLTRIPGTFSGSTYRYDCHVHKKSFLIPIDVITKHTPVR